VRVRVSVSVRVHVWEFVRVCGDEENGRNEKKMCVHLCVSVCMCLCVGACG